MIEDVVIKAASGICSSFMSHNNMMNIIEHLYSSMYEICYEIKEAKLDVAKDSLKNIIISKSSQTKNNEIYKAISALENAYNLALRLLDKVYYKKESVLLFFFYTDKTPAVPLAHRKKWHESLIDISSLIYLLYKYKEEHSIAQLWHGRSLKLWSEYVNSYKQLSAEELYRINHDYAYESKHDECETVEYNEFFSKAENITVYEWHVTSLGAEYAQRRISKLLKDFDKGLHEYSLSF